VDASDSDIVEEPRLGVRIVLKEGDLDANTTPSTSLPPLPQVPYTYPPPPAGPAPPAPPSFLRTHKNEIAIGTTLGAFVAGGTFIPFVVKTQQDHNKSSQNQTSEAFEGRANAELVGRALGDHDLDK